MPGIRRSSSITSGRCRSMRTKASCPFHAAPTTLRLSWVPSMLARPARTTGWSSTIRIRTLPFASLLITETSQSEDFDVVGEARERKAQWHWRCDDNTSTGAGGTGDLQRCSDSFGAFAHPLQAKAANRRGWLKTDAVILYHHRYPGGFVFRLNEDGRRGAVQQGIGDGLLTDAKQGIFDGIGETVFLSAYVEAHVDGAVLDHAPGKSFQGGVQWLRLKELAAQGHETATRLLMTVPHQLAGELQLVVDLGKVTGHTVANGLQLEADADKALGERIVHFMGDSFPLVEYRLESPVVEADIDQQGKQKQYGGAESEEGQTAGAPPGRAGQHFDVVG